MVPGIVDSELVQEELKTNKAQTPNAYRFGGLSHHSFFSRHHLQPQHVAHISDLHGKPICVVKDFSLGALPQSTLFSRCVMGIPTVSTVIGDPKSNRKPQFSASDTWKKKLKDLADQVAVYTKESELKIEILELLCQILQTDSLSTTQFWLLYAPPQEKDLVLGLLQTAVAQLIPKSLSSIPMEKLLNQLQELQEQPQESQQPFYSLFLKKTKIPPISKFEKPERMGKAHVLHLRPTEDSEAKAIRKSEPER